MINYTTISQINQSQVIAQLEKNKKLSYVFPYSNRKTEEFLTSNLDILLVHLNKPGLSSSLQYCVREMVMNASKANSKRIYFQESNLDINNDADYNKGIENFKKDVFTDFDKWESKHKEMKLYVKIDYLLKEKDIIIAVTNNSLINNQEQQRISERLKIADKFNNMQEVLTHGFDTTEGAGFGLIIVTLMLRKMGLDEKMIQFKQGENTTTMFVTIPKSLLSAEQGNIITAEITAEIDKMPQFPESILRLQQNLNNPNCNFESISEIIKTDSSLTTEIIRIANSSIYRLPQKIEDIFTAVKMIGIKGIKNLLLSYGANKVFAEMYDKEKIKKIMEHCHQVAVISSQICKLKKMMKYHDDVYVACLLHDFGRIIIETLQPELVEKIQSICEKKGISISLLEDLTDGYNHSIVGSMLAEKWEFPEKFCQSIKYHHIPLEADEEHKPIVSIVYLANELFYCLTQSREVELVNYKILKQFGIDQENTFRDFLSQIHLEQIEELEES